MKKLLLPLVFIGTSFLYILSRSPAAAIAGFATPPTDVTTSDTAADTNKEPASTASVAAAILAPLPKTTTVEAKAMVPAVVPPDPVPVPTPIPTPLVSAPPPAAGSYADGTYTGSAADAGYGMVQVRAVISGGRISDVVFLSHPTTPANSIVVNNMAMPILIQEAIAAQSANVGIVSGATYTSQAFQQSLASALSMASVVPVPVPVPTPTPTPTPTPPPPAIATQPAPAPAGGYQDGTYTGSVAQAGSRGPIQVQATIAGGQITAVTFLQHPTAASESAAIYNNAAPILIQEAIAAQSANIATVSGATLDSAAFQQSLVAALAFASTSGSSSTTAGTSSSTPAPTPTSVPSTTRTRTHHESDD